MYFINKNKDFLFRLILVSGLLTVFTCQAIARQQQQQQQQRQQIPAQRVYQIRINDFVDGVVSKTSEQFKPEKPGYQSIIDACGGKDGMKNVRAIFRRKLTEILDDSLRSFFRSGLGLRHFTTNMALVRRDCLTRANSSVISARINNILEQICSTPPPSMINKAPVANAGNDISITLPVNYATLRGSGTDPEGHPLRFRWSRISGNDNAVVVSANNATTRIENLTTGVYRYTLMVTDSLGASGYDTVIITVNAQRLPPVANAGPAVEITLPANSVVLTGNGADPQQSILRFEWVKISGNGGYIVNDTSRSTVVRDLQQGTYLFRLTVTNRFRLSASDTVQVIVHPRPNNQPRADAGNDIHIRLPQDSVQLSGNGTDPDGDTLRYSWKFLSGPSPVAIASPQNKEVKLLGLEAGDYYFSLTVADGRGMEHTDSLRVQVDPLSLVNTAPTVSAGPDLKLDLSEARSIQFQATASDSDGSIVSYHWEKLSGPESFEFINADKAEGRIENPAEGSYLFQLTVTDDGGQTASDIVMLQVNRTVAAGIPLWLIITGALGAGALIWAGLKFIWLGKEQKVIAYYLNSKEESLVQQFMPLGDKTESYSVGHLSRRRIRQLKKQGVAFRILNTTELRVNTPGANHEYRFSRKKGKYIPKGETVNTGKGNFSNIIPVKSSGKKKDTAFPLFYIITLDSPLLPKFQIDLQENGIEVLQRIPYDSYLVVVTNIRQISLLESKHFSFIRVVRPYGPEDTGFFMLKERMLLPGIDNPGSIDVDLVLHRERDIHNVTLFLNSLGIEPIARFRNIIRIRIVRNAEQAYELASNIYIQAIYEHIPPVLHNDFARKLIGLEDNSDHPEVSLVEETGEDEIVAVADTGIDRQHPDFLGRIQDTVSWGRPGLKDSSDPHGHGTHVAGSIVGTGEKSGGRLRGVAPGAKVFFQSLIDNNNHLVDLRLNLSPLLQQAYEAGSRIMNISWGSPTEACYTHDAVAIDQFVFDNPDMLVVVSAGNENRYRTDSRGRQISMLGLVGSLATNKNGLTVGASYSNRNNNDAQSIAIFSSRGPCKPELRIKPDLVAPGTNIMSTRSSRAPKTNFETDADVPPGNFYAYMRGSSMAAPIVAGCAALVRQYYRNKKNYNPSAALVKATIINGTKLLQSESATEDSKSIPNNSQGFGLLDLLMTIPNKQTGFNLQYHDAMFDPALMLSEAGKTKIFKLEVQRETWLRACLVFVDNPKIGAQNDLNLIVGLDGTNKKWTGNEGINANAGNLSYIEEDFINNIEIVRLANAKPGTYTIAVAASIAMIRENVGFAIVVTTGDTSAKLT